MGFRVLPRLNSSVIQLIDGMVGRIGRADAVVFWNYMLSGLRSSTDRTANKRFAIIINVLNELNKKDVPSKQMFDIVTRCFIELPKLNVAELVEICEHCIDSLRIEQPKSIG